MLKKNQLSKSEHQHRWAFFVTLFLGVWLFFTPITLGIAQEEILQSDQIVALLLIVCSCFALKGNRWFPWILALLGVYLEFAPLLFWAKEPISYLNDTLTGILVFYFSLVLPGTPGLIDPDEGQIPEGWDYNPSSWTQRFPILVLGIIGWFSARLMCAYQLGYIDSIWDPFFGDGTIDVITSSISKAFPFPDAGLGAFAYSLEVLLVLKGRTARWRTMPWLVTGFSFLVVPLGLTSILLVILQPLMVGAWCSYCLLAAFSMLLMCLFTLDEVAAVFQLLVQAYKEGHFWRTFIHGSCPKGVKDDPLTNRFPLPPKMFLVEMCRGVTFVPSLLLAAGLGALFMLSPFLFGFDGMLSDFYHTLGALTIVVSILSLADVARPLCKINFVFALVLFIATLYGEIEIGTKILLSALLVLLSFCSYKGK